MLDPIVRTGIGIIRICEEGGAVTKCHFIEHAKEVFPDFLPQSPAAAQLKEYFEGRRKKFDIRLKPKGTDFQKLVWAKVKEIPYGNAASYSALAESLGMPNSARAVGAAIGKNPILIFIPCHRVVGSGGGLSGYSGGMARKRKLLLMESQSRQGSLF